MHGTRVILRICQFLIRTHPVEASLVYWPHISHILARGCSRLPWNVLQASGACWSSENGRLWCIKSSPKVEHIFLTHFSSVSHEIRWVGNTPIRGVNSVRISAKHQILQGKYWDYGAFIQLAANVWCLWSQVVCYLWEQDPCNDHLPYLDAPSLFVLYYFSGHHAYLTVVIFICASVRRTSHIPYLYSYIPESVNSK